MLRIRANISKRIKPPPKLSMSQWADRYRRLPAISNESGRWRTDKTAYMREIMDAIGDRLIQEVVIMSSAQVGKSELLLNAIGYYSEYDPSPMLLVQPTIDNAEKFSKQRIAPMIECTPALKATFGDVKSRGSGNTIREKYFNGGFLSISGANSPSSLCSMACRIILADEIDRFPDSAGAEGDPLKLAAKRATTFSNRKLISVSTPTVKNLSRIEKAFESSTQEHYQLQCPDCLDYQKIVHDSIVIIKKEDGLPTEVLGKCESCGVLNTEFDWKKNPGRWKAFAKHKSCRGFALNEWVSPWKRWLEIELDFFEAKKSFETLKTWVNTSAGETWEERGAGLKWELIASRATEWDHAVPDEVLVLTAGVDTQDNRFVVEIVGHTANGCDYSISYESIMGDPTDADTKKRLYAHLDQSFIHESGRELKVQVACIDSGGHATQSVYDFCARFHSRGFLAIKGKGGDSIPFVSKPKRVKMRPGGSLLLYSLGVNEGKTRVYRRLRNEDQMADYSFFPLGRENEYFQELTAERLVTRSVAGRPSKKWIQIRSRNEALDCRNYAMAALEILKPNFDQILLHLKRQHEEAPQKARSNKNKKKSYVNSWKN